jgi:hypothetical protein
MAAEMEVMVVVVAVIGANPTLRSLVPSMEDTGVLSILAMLRTSLGCWYLINRESLGFPFLVAAQEIYVGRMCMGNKGNIC